MGCLSVVVGLLALAVPASIARASLVGAYVVLALLVIAAVLAVRYALQRRRKGGAAVGPGRATAVVVGLGAVYAVVIAVIHAA